MNEQINKIKEEYAEKLNLLQEEFNDRLDQLAKQTEPHGKWKPRRGQTHYYADPSFKCFYIMASWCDNTSDNHRYNAGLIRKTPEEAIEVGKRMYYRQWFRDLSDVTEHTWMESSIDKFYAYYDWDVEQVCYDSRSLFMCEATYFTAMEKLESAIETIGRTNFMKYVMGVEDEINNK